MEPRPGPDCGSRITTINHQGSTVTASLLPRQFPNRSRSPRTGPDDLAAELNPHKTEFEPP